MKELNGDYLDTTLTANKTNWYNSYWDSANQKPVLRQTETFNYTTVIKQKYQDMISNSVWNIGGNTYIGSEQHTLNLLTQYNRERNKITYQNSRPTTWTGKVGLIYASDYGYASSNKECHSNLHGRITYDNTNGLCENYNWLLKNSSYYTLSPYSGGPSTVFYVGNKGYIDEVSAYNSYSVFPSVYLKSDIKITSGTGEKSNPYNLG